MEREHDGGRKIQGQLSIQALLWSLSTALQMGPAVNPIGMDPIGHGGNSGPYINVSCVGQGVYELRQMDRM